MGCRELGATFQSIHYTMSFGEITADTTWFVWSLVVILAFGVCAILMFVNVFICGRGKHPSAACNKRTNRGVTWTLLSIPMSYVVAILTNVILAIVLTMRSNSL